MQREREVATEDASTADPGSPISWHSILAAVTAR